ncbi:hypothetical protein PPYR_11006 [Photinus pyralis]|uniref:Insulin-like domain-containing protein n=1 Tax=Photinus pyralis TaxID=7054 RepID=A0A1Y1LW82_PHOPY|nr:insulin-1 [Photinus pyralis]KAB0796945.1 hypothetical protein PPYR_11006 [Photinus pyralis]
MERIFLFIVLLLTFTCLTFEFEMSQKEMKSIKGKFCGSYLADTMSMVCEGMYNSKGKRNMLGNLGLNKVNSREDYDENENVFYVDELVPSFPFRSREHARSLIPFDYQKRSRKPGIVDECCHKACSFFEMASYCGKP